MALGTEYYKLYIIINLEGYTVILKENNTGRKISP